MKQKAYYANAPHISPGKSCKFRVSSLEFQLIIIYIYISIYSYIEGNLMHAVALCARARTRVLS